MADYMSLEEELTGKRIASGQRKPRPVVTVVIIILNVIAFFLAQPLRELTLALGALSVESVVQEGEYYRLITSMFLHGDIEHLFRNMMVLFFLGSAVEAYLGHIKWYILYFLSGVIGNLVSIYIDLNTANPRLSIGASGAVFGAMGATLIIALTNRRLMKNNSSLGIRILLMIGFSVYSGLVSDGINNAAHIGGLFGGMLIAVLFTGRSLVGANKEEWL